jgi:hypothetical protein
MIVYPVIDDLILPEVVHELTMEEELEIMKFMEELAEINAINEQKAIESSKKIVIF